jgi:geranylgeranyl pyrophosphate synthase
VGKSIGRDLEKGKLTLPMILHIGATRGDARLAALDAIDAKDGAALRRALEESGSIDAARARAVAIVEEAKRELPATTRTGARELLLELADRVVARDH